MNRYQQAVAEIDDRHRRLVRSLSFAGAAALTALALWSAGFPPAAWWTAAQRWWSSREPAAQVATTVGAAEPSTARAPGVDTGSEAAQSGGTDSSISSRPLPLHLVATTPGRNPSEGTAQIGTNRETPQTYVAGAILVNGARLAEIHSDHVVLERGTNRASLFLASAGIARPQGSADLATVPAMPKEAARPELLGVDSLGEVIRSMAYYENDMLHGLQVFPGRQSGTFARLGLKPADVIVAIDAVAVTDAQNAIEYLQALTQGAAISVRVRRDGTNRTLSLDGGLVKSSISRTSAPAQPGSLNSARTSQ